MKIANDMQLEAEIEVVENLYQQAKFLRTSTKKDAFKARAANDWEIKLLGELDRLKAQATVPADHTHHEQAA